MLRGSPAYEYVLKKQAIPVEFERIEHVAQSLNNRSVSIALLDVRVASYHEHVMKGKG